MLREMELPLVTNVVAVGKPISGVTVRLSQNNEIVVKGNLSNGYLGGEKFTEFYTGDIGFCQNDVWYVQGRVDDVIKVNGQFVSPTQVEMALDSVFGVVCAAAIVDEKVYALVDKECCFQREAMRQAGIPWHLIPKQVFMIPEIPTSKGAGKVDRAKVKQLVRQFIAAQVSSIPINSDNACDAILSNVLGVASASEKSFVELGGDSALAITLLYKLRVAGHLRDLDVTAADILESDTINDLRDMVSGKISPKRRKKLKTIESIEPFVVRPVKRCSDNHMAVDFRACVDVPPLVHGTIIYGACQRGVVQRITNQEVVTCHELLGWKVQAGMLVVNESLIVCGYKKDQDCGIVVALTLDLTSVKWSTECPGQIKSTLISVKDQLWVVAGGTLVVLDSGDGKQVSSLLFPSKTESRPAKIITSRGLPLVVYAFSDWETVSLLWMKKALLQREHLLMTLSAPFMQTFSLSTRAD